MAAETGSGKTGAFCLPILQIVHETLRDIREGKNKNRGGGGCASTPWRMSFFDRGNSMAITPDGLRCQSREQREWHGCKATTGVRGNFYSVHLDSVKKVLIDPTQETESSTMRRLSLMKAFAALDGRQKRQTLI